MTLPFDPSKPEKRPIRVVFWTDELTSQWLSGQAAENDLEMSLICHRIIKQARESTLPSEGERRSGDRRLTA